MQKSLIILLLLLPVVFVSAQQKSLFKPYLLKEVPQNYFGEIYITRDGKVFISSSEFSFLQITGNQAGAFTFGLDKQDYKINGLKSIFTGTPLKNIVESGDSIIFVVVDDKQITFFSNSEKNSDSVHCDIPPFYFPAKGDTNTTITGLWTDKNKNLYIGSYGAFYFVAEGGSSKKLSISNYVITNNAAGEKLITKGEMPVKKIKLTGNKPVYAFAESAVNKNIIWVGCGEGLKQYEKQTGVLSEPIASTANLNVTDIEALPNGDTWFSTLEKGMGVYHQQTNLTEFFPYTKQSKQASFPVNNFCIKSPTEFFVAVADSVPAIFNTEKKSYLFFADTSFVLSKNKTTDIDFDTSGNFYFIKGGLLYSSNIADNLLWAGGNANKKTYTPLIYGVVDFNQKEITNYLTHPEWLQQLELSYKENSIIIYLTSDYTTHNKPIRYEWMLEGDVNNWVTMPAYSAENDSAAKVELPDIKPGKYKFKARVKIGDGEWSTKEASMIIIVTPPYWHTWWFWTIIVIAFAIIACWFFWWRVQAIKRREKEKFEHQKKILELEAKALRAQMNPHFIFNCLNSIKALTLNNETQKATEYLTTFSKLIRTLFQNADKRQISLYDEIETCKHYIQLEAMRLNDKLRYHFDIDPNLDLKSIQVPALIIQPFIENAIWHGIVPRGEGSITIKVYKNEDAIKCEVDDDGIGRELSKLNKPATPVLHESKGVHLSQARLNLEKLLNEMNASIETVDKYEGTKATGTKVILTFNLN